jgi:hypothetical protein
MHAAAMIHRSSVVLRLAIMLRSTASIACDQMGSA